MKTFTIPYLPLTLIDKTLGVVYTNDWMTEIIFEKDSKTKIREGAFESLTRRRHLKLTTPDIVLSNVVFDSFVGGLMSFDDIQFSPRLSSRKVSMITHMLSNTPVITGVDRVDTLTHVDNIPITNSFFECVVSPSRQEDVNPPSDSISEDFDPVKKPKGYALDDKGTELQDLMPILLGKFTGYEAFIVGNIIKYTIRFKDKNGIEDLNKVKQYTDMLIKMQDEK